jgi:hypothetical protein
VSLGLESVDGLDEADLPVSDQILQGDGPADHVPDRLRYMMDQSLLLEDPILPGGTHQVRWMAHAVPSTTTRIDASWDASLLRGPKTRPTDDRTSQVDSF